MQNITDTLIMPAPPPVTQRLGPYDLLNEAGRGGMSVVYEALDRRDQRTVAVKVLNMPHGLTRDQEEAMLGRFSREARAVAGLSHPNIVAIHELGEESGKHFLVMEYLRGESLRDRLLHGPLTPAQALPIFHQIADALDAVHAQGVVHRDIKPSNVMLLPDGTAKLLDFGVARQSDDTTITGTGALVGSPAYLSPEQVRGAEGTPASDIWAMGALLYEMLSGHPPFTGKNIPAVLYQVTHETPPPVVGIPTPVQRVLRRALDKNPSRRYPNARSLAQALQTALPEFSAVDTPRRLPIWLWVALLPVLLGVALVALTQHRTPRHPAAAPLAAPIPLPAPMTATTPIIPPAVTPPRVPSRRSTGTNLHRSMPHHSGVAKKPHFLKIARHRVLIQHRHVFHRVRRLRHERRFYSFNRFRPPTYHPAPSASSGLDHFIYSPESP